MNLLQLMYFILAFTTLASAMAVVIVPNPVFSALSLAVCMLGIAGLFFTLEAYFVAGGSTHYLWRGSCCHVCYDIDDI